MEDVLIYTNTLQEHLESLRKVYEVLREEKFYANPDKCSHAQPEIEYCGFLLGVNGIRPQPRKLMAVHIWPVPRTPQEIKSFLGLCGFYQRFVEDYATVAAPLTDLIKKKVEWIWGT